MTGRTAGICPVEDERGVMVVREWPCLFTTCERKGPRVNGYLCCVDCALGGSNRLPLDRVRVESRGGFYDAAKAKAERMAKIRDRARDAVVAWGSGRFLDERMRDLQAAIVEDTDAE